MGGSVRQLRSPPTVVASDLDGTLLRTDGTVDDRSRRALAAVEEAGSVFVLCTARPTRWMRPIAEAMGHHGVAICANGGIVWDLHSESVLQTVALEPAVLRDVVGRLQSELPGGNWAVERSDSFAHEPGYEPRWPVPAGTVVDDIGTLVNEPAVKLLLRHDELDADALLARAREIVGDACELSHSNSADALLEIAAAGVSKATALAEFCAERGVGPEEVMAFGDMPNDVAMLAWAGYAVAVANAHPDVVAAADEVTASNDDAGVARVLERVFGV